MVLSLAHSEALLKIGGKRKIFLKIFFYHLLSTIAIINTQIYNDYSVIEVSTTQPCTIVIQMDTVYGLLVLRMVWKALKDKIVLKHFFFLDKEKLDNKESS